MPHKRNTHTQVFEQWEAGVELSAALEEALSALRQAMRGACCYYVILCIRVVLDR